MPTRNLLPTLFFSLACSLSLLANAADNPPATATPAPAKMEEANPAEEEHPGPGFTFVCLKSAQKPDLEKLRGSLAKWFKLSGPDQVKPVETGDDNKAIFSYVIDGNTFVISEAETPIPKEDIEYACSNSFLWPEASEIVSQHKAHLVIFTEGKFASAAEEGLAISRVAAACTECFDALAVYWGQANTVHKPEMFREAIQSATTEMKGLPVMMWIGFLRAKGEAGGLDVYTSGLSAFGVMEAEIIDSKKDPMEVIDLLAGLATYLITKGNIIQDGDTVGGDEKQQINAHYANSVIGRPGKVLRIDF